VQVYSNLYRVKLDQWKLFEHPQVSLATSYYSDVTEEHERVTGRQGSHAATRANIVQAVQRGIPLQVGIVEVFEGQRTAQAREELLALGVRTVNVDRVRSVGRGEVHVPSTKDLCGRPGRGHDRRQGHPMRPGPLPRHGQREDRRARRGLRRAEVGGHRGEYPAAPRTDGRLHSGRLQRLRPGEHRSLRPCVLGTGGQ
jgi:hypothetical protein